MGSAYSAATADTSGDEGHVTKSGDSQTLWLVAIGAAALLIVVWLFNRK
jgi:LPXTG-motif cell wall-anchored protein